MTKYSAVLRPLEEAISALRRVDPDCAALILLRIASRDLVERGHARPAAEPYFRAPAEAIVAAGEAV